MPGIEKEEGQNNVTMSFFLSPWKVYIRSGNKGEFVNVASHLLGGEFSHEFKGECDTITWILFI